MPSGGGIKTLGNWNSYMHQLSPLPGETYFCSEKAHHTRSKHSPSEGLLQLLLLSRDRDTSQAWQTLRRWVTTRQSQHASRRNGVIWHAGVRTTRATPLGARQDCTARRRHASTRSVARPSLPTPRSLFGIRVRRVQPFPAEPQP